MYPEDTYRAFLLGTADREIEAGVEEELLDGRLHLNYLRQIEDELIDDLLFGRLSKEEEPLFRSRLLSSPERAEKLEFARALHQYATRPTTTATRPGLFARMREWMLIPWVLPLAGALGCAVLTTAWLGQRNRNLNQELALATHTNSEQQRTISSMLEERRQKSAVVPAQPAAVAPAQEASVQPVFRLSPGVQRGFAVVPVLSLKQQASNATIVLELPFRPAGTLHEELLDADGRAIWKHELPVTRSIVAGGMVSVVIPATTLIPGEYRLRVNAGASGEEQADEATYLFRVRKD